MTPKNTFKPAADWLSRKLSPRCQQQEQKLREVLLQLWPDWQRQAATALSYQVQFEHFPQSLLVYVAVTEQERDRLLALLPSWHTRLQQALLKKGILLKPPFKHIAICTEIPLNSGRIA